MTKLPRDSSHDQIRRLLVRHGWVVAREGSRHTIMGRGPEHIAIPRHSKLKTGTVAAILKQAGIRADDALRDL